MRAKPNSIETYCFRKTIQTRWNDNDIYGHINNAVYYTWFDTLVNDFLIENGMLAMKNPRIIGLVVNTACQYFSPLSYPQAVTTALRLGSIGTSSVRYEIGIFAPGASLAAAQGHFTHVYVDAKTRKPATLTGPMKTLLSTITTANL